MKTLHTRIEEPSIFNKESEFEDFMVGVLNTILSNLMKQGHISNYYIFRHLGFDIAVFLDVKGRSKVKFLELKLYKGQRAGGVGLSEGPQVEVLMNSKEVLKFFNKFLRWLIYDALASSNRRYVFINNPTAKRCAMGEVRKGKQNNFNINRLRDYAITWN